MMVKKEWYYKDIDRFDIQGVCWREGCSNKSLFSPMGRYKNIYCEEHKRNVQSNKLCKIDGCTSVASCSTSLKGTSPTRCISHSNKPTHFSVLYNKCSKHGCMFRGRHSESGCNDIESYCGDHKKRYHKIIKLHCNYFKCNNIPTMGYADEKYPLVCAYHRDDL